MVQQKLRAVSLTSVPLTRYARHKLTAEDVTVIKKAVTQFATTELVVEKEILLKKLNHNDFFLCLYTRNTRIRKRDKNKNKKEVTNP